MKNRFLPFLFMFFSFGFVSAQGAKKIKVPAPSQNPQPKTCRTEIFGKKLELKTRDDFKSAVEGFRTEHRDRLMAAVYNPDIEMVKINHGVYRSKKHKEVYWTEGEMDPYYASLNIELIDVVDGIAVRAGWAPNTKYISELDKLKKAYLSAYPNDELKVLGYFDSVYRQSNIMLYCDLYDGDNLVDTKQEPILKMYLGQSFGHRIFSFPTESSGDYSIKFRFAELTVDPNVQDKKMSITKIGEPYDAETLTLQEFYDQTYGDCLELLEFDKGVYTLVYPDFVRYEWKNDFSRFLGSGPDLKKYFKKYSGYEKKGMKKEDFHPWMFRQKGGNKSYSDILAMKNHNSNFNFVHDGKVYRLADSGWIYIPDPGKLNSDVYDVKQIVNRMSR